MIIKKKQSPRSAWSGPLALTLIGIALIAGILYLFRDQEKPSMPQSSHVTDELKRTRALLSPKRVNTTLTEITADPAPETIGAQAGVGFKADKSGVTFNVYVFEDWDKSSAAVDAFDRKHAADGNVYVATSMNGALAFYGFVRTDTRDGTTKQFQLAEFMSAFAGDE